MHIIKFFTKIARNGDERHYVEYAPSAAEAHRSTTVSLVNHLKPREYIEDERIAGEQVIAHWDQFLGPAYEAWLKGQELPEIGTSIAAASFLDADQIHAMRQAGILSIEDLAGANEGVLASVKVTNIRALQQLAKDFLSMQDTAKAVAEINGQAAQIEALQAQIEALQAEKPKRGRPPKEAAA